MLTIAFLPFSLHHSKPSLPPLFPPVSLLYSVHILLQNTIRPVNNHIHVNGYYGDYVMQSLSYLYNIITGRANPAPT